MMIIAQMYPGAIGAGGCGAGGITMSGGGVTGGMVIVGAGTCVIVTGGCVGAGSSITVKLAIADQLPSTGASGLTAQ